MREHTEFQTDVSKPMVSKISAPAAAEASNLALSTESPPPLPEVTPPPTRTKICSLNANLSSYVNVKLGKKPSYALIDSGASVNVCSPLFASFVKPIRSSFITIKSASNDKLQIIKKGSLSIFEHR